MDMDQTGAAANRAWLTPSLASGSGSGYTARLVQNILWFGRRFREGPLQREAYLRTLQGGAPPRNHVRHL